MAPKSRKKAKAKAKKKRSPGLNPKKPVTKISGSGSSSSSGSGRERNRERESSSASLTTVAERERGTGFSSPTTGAEETEAGSFIPTTGVERETGTGSSSATMAAEKETEAGSFIPTTGVERETETGSSSPTRAKRMREVEETPDDDDDDFEEEGHDYKTPTPTRTRAEEEGSGGSPWSGGSFAEVAKQGHMNAQLKKTTPEDIKRATIQAKVALLKPKVPAPKKLTVDDPKRAKISDRKAFLARLGEPKTGSSGHSSLSKNQVPAKDKTLEARKAETDLINQRLQTQSVTRLNAAKAKARKEEEAMLATAMDFFERFNKRGEEELKCSMCSGKVASMIRKGGTVLRIDFRLLLNKKYKTFALKVGKEVDRSYTWLKPTLISFLVNEGMTENDASNIEIIFKNRPSSIQTVAELMQNKEKIARDVRLLHGERTVYAAATLGRDVFRAHVEAFFSKHDEGVTYSGIFGLEDLLILDEERVVILADPVVPSKTVANPFGHALPEDKCKDMSKVWTLLSPFYTRKGADGRDELPLHFEDLRMELLEVKPADVTTEPFRELIRCCFGLASCMAGVIFTKGVYLVTKTFGIGADPKMKKVFSDAPNTRLKDFKVHSQGSSVAAINGVANFKDSLQKLPDNTYGCLGVDRHVLEHGADYSDLDDLDELELLTSDEYRELRHPILKALIYGSDPCGKYASILSVYKAAAKNDKQDLPGGS